MSEYTKNSSRVLNAEGKPIVPGAYELLSVVLKRSGMTDIPVTTLVTDITFTEELFSPVLVAKISISDRVGLLKQNSDVLRGHEIVEISMRFIDYSPQESTELKFELSVREYGDFELDSEGLYSGRFVITAVDHFAILSRFQQISFAVGKPNDDRRRDKDPIEHVAYIFEKYLKLKPNVFDYNVPKNRKCSAKTKFKAIIPYSTPLQAIEWLRKKSFDDDKSPFFVYGVFNNQETLPRKILARSWNHLTDIRINDIYASYIKKYNHDSYKSDRERYFAEKQRILDFEANVSKNELSKFLQGEYNSYVKTINYWSSTFSDIDTPDNEVPSVSNTLERSTDNTKTFEYYRQKFIENSRSQRAYLDSLYQDAQHLQKEIVPPALVIHNPLPLYGDSQETYTENPEMTDALRVANWHSRILRYYATKISTEQCEITVYGDIQLNPGKLLFLAIDSDSDESERNGTYIIIASVHSFENGIYMNRLKLVRLYED